MKTLPKRQQLKASADTWQMSLVSWFSSLRRKKKSCVKHLLPFCGWCSLISTSSDKFFRMRAVVWPSSTAWYRWPRAPPATKCANPMSFLSILKGPQSLNSNRWDTLALNKLWVKRKLLYQMTFVLTVQVAYWSLGLIWAANQHCSGRLVSQRLWLN